MFKVQTYDHYGDIQLLNHLTNVLRMESPMSAESVGADVDDVNQRWNQLLTGTADREVLSLLILCAFNALLFINHANSHLKLP